MSLQVFSPHSHSQSNDPQSPYPCTPSTLCSSPITHSGGSSNSGTGAAGGRTSNNTNNQSYFRTSHHQHQFLLRETTSLTSSPSRQTEDQVENASEGEMTMVMMDYDPHRYRRSEAGILDSPEMPMSIRSPSMSTLGGTPDRSSPRARGVYHNDGANVNNGDSSGMKSHPSAASIPIILAGLNGIKASLGRERKKQELLHGKERSEDTLASSVEDASEDDHARHEVAEQEQRGSVGLGLGILQEPIQLAEEGYAYRRSSRDEAHSSQNSEIRWQQQAILPLPQDADDASPSDLTAPRQDRADSWTSSLVSTGDDSVASSTSSSSTTNARPGTPNASPPSSSIPGKLLPPHEEYGVGAIDKAKSMSYYSIPEHPRHIEVLPRTIRNSLKSDQEIEKVESPSQGSEFSISAYDYSPHIPQEAHLNQWSVLPGGQDGSVAVEAAGGKPASRVNSLIASAPFSNLHTVDEKRPTSEEEATPVPREASSTKKQKKKAILNLSVESELKKENIKRRRAVTLANPPEGEEDLRKNLRRQSSPPMLSSARFVDQYATISNMKKRPTTATVDGATRLPVLSASPFLKDVPSRPHTANTVASARTMSPATLFKPLPALPPFASEPASHQKQTLQDKRPGFLSVQTSPRKTTFSRPGTASPAARSFGLVAPYANLSPTYRDYRSLKSRESFTSLLDKKNGGNSGNRSRSVSVSSSISNSKKRGSKEEENLQFIGPPRYISFAIDQESFREICPIFELVESIPSSLASSSSSSGTSERGAGASNGNSTTYRYMPIHAEQAYPFHHATLESPPVLRRLLIDKYESKDFISKQSFLPVKNEGIYAVNGMSYKGDYSWRFEYKVMDRVNLIGRPIPGEKNLVPMAFTCAAGVLDPNNARKRKAMDVVYKTLSSKLEALRVGDLPPDCEE